jgi:diguanylate cyclase (GGDEF)-like protein
MLASDLHKAICTSYEFTCPVCGAGNDFYRLKRDVCQIVDKEGDGHPLSYKWTVPGSFGLIDPKRFFFSTCRKCHFTGEIDDTKFRTSPRDPQTFLKDFSLPMLRLFVERWRQNEGVVVDLSRKITASAPLMGIVAQMHLGIYAHCLKLKMEPGPLGRYYLRLAWVYRDLPLFYSRENIENLSRNLGPFRQAWADEIPPHKDYPVVPALALNEVEALHQSRVYFQTNFEQLRHATLEDEVRLRFLLAEIAYRVFELTGSDANFKTASSFYSGTMQKCLDIIGDKGIVGGAVSRARQLLELSGDRGRELRALRSKGTLPQTKTPTKPQTKTKISKAKANSKSGSTNPSRSATPQAGKATVKAKATEQDNGVSKVKQRVVAQPSQVEVLALKERLLQLENENRRWRELMGKDPLTGLPNKVSLFHIVIPKVLKQLNSVGSFGFIGIGLENISAVNHQHGWDAGDMLMRQAVGNMRHLVNTGEELYRLDGANFSVVGRMRRGEAALRAEKMQNHLEQVKIKTDELELQLAVSMVVLVVEKQIGTSIEESVDSIHHCLVESMYEAKKTGDGEVSILQQTEF